MTGSFLERWSRLKREAEAAPDGDDQRPDGRSPDDQTPDSQVPDNRTPDNQTSDPAPVQITEEEIAALPRPEDLTAESDITCFMRPGVPDKLRNAALRRMWLLDSAIRDFVGPARDYSYDWNQIGDVPGSGLLDSQEEIAAMLRGLFGRDPEPEQDQDSAKLPPKGNDAAPDGKSHSA